MRVQSMGKDGERLLTKLVQRLLHIIDTRSRNECFSQSSPKTPTPCGASSNLWFPNSDANLGCVEFDSTSKRPVKIATVVIRSALRRQYFTKLSMLSCKTNPFNHPWKTKNPMKNRKCSSFHRSNADALSQNQYTSCLVSEECDC